MAASRGGHFKAVDHSGSVARRASICFRPVAGYVVPGIPHRVLDVLPARLRPVLVLVPTASQVRFDLVPLAASIPLGRLEPVAIARLIGVVSAVAPYVGARSEVRAPIIVLGRPVGGAAG